MIQWQDGINGMYELLGAPFIFLSIMKLYKDKIVRGVNWMAVAFFASWGVWNLYYYYHLSQFCSWFGGMAIVTANAIWLIMMLHYIRKEKILEMKNKFKDTPKGMEVILDTTRDNITKTERH